MIEVGDFFCCSPSSRTPVSSVAFVFFCWVVVNRISKQKKCWNSKLRFLVPNSFRIHLRNCLGSLPPLFFHKYRYRNAFLFFIDLFRWLFFVLFFIHLRSVVFQSSLISKCWIFFWNFREWRLYSILLMGFWSQFSGYFYGKWTSRTSHWLKMTLILSDLAVFFLFFSKHVSFWCFQQES